MSLIEERKCFVFPTITTACHTFIHGLVSMKLGRHKPWSSAFLIFLDLGPMKNCRVDHLPNDPMTLINAAQRQFSLHNLYFFEIV